MGIGKAFKRATGKIGMSVANLTGSEALGRTAAIAAGSFGSIPGMFAASSGFSREQRQATQEQNLKMQGLQNPDLQAKIAEEQRLRLISEEDLKTQEEALKKRTTFAGSSIATDLIRRKLLG